MPHAAPTPVDLADTTDPVPPRTGRDELTGQDVARQAETYSNAIVAFTAFQALTFSYVFGTNPQFGCLIRSEAYLGVALTLMFVVVLVLISTVMRFLSGLIQSVAGRFREAMRHIYRAKLIAVLVFTALPLTLTFVYGVLLREPASDCRRVPLPHPAAGSVVETRPLKPLDGTGTGTR